MFRQMMINFWKIPRFEKGWKNIEHDLKWWKSCSIESYKESLKCLIEDVFMSYTVKNVYNMTYRRYNFHNVFWQSLTFESKTAFFLNIYTVGLVF
jgi:hypothetical protein